MKKVLLATLAGALCAPALLAQPADVPAKQDNPPAVENQQPRQPGDFKQAREKHEARLKATQEKMTQLVAEYNKLKAGKKKEAKKAEIAKAVAVIHEEQIKFKEKNIADFEKRLEKMKEALAAQKTQESQKEWVDQRTAKLIEENGDMRVLFDSPLGAPGMGGMNHKPGFGGPGMKPGKGGKDGQFRHGKGGPQGPQGCPCAAGGPQLPPQGPQGPQGGPAPME